MRHSVHFEKVLRGHAVEADCCHMKGHDLQAFFPVLVGVNFQGVGFHCRTACLAQLFPSSGRVPSCCQAVNTATPEGKPLTVAVKKGPLRSIAIHSQFGFVLVFVIYILGAQYSTE